MRGSGFDFGLGVAGLEPEGLGSGTGFGGDCGFQGPELGEEPDDPKAKSLPIGSDGPFPSATFLLGSGWLPQVFILTGVPHASGPE